MKNNIIKINSDLRKGVLYCIYNVITMEVDMIKRLTTHGNSLALIIEKPILDLLNIKQKTPLKITTDGTNIIISPIKKVSREKAFQSALAKVNKHHGKTLKKLAG